jgi:hypothetical protein
MAILALACAMVVGCNSSKKGKGTSAAPIFGHQSLVENEQVISVDQLVNEIRSDHWDTMKVIYKGMAFETNETVVMPVVHLDQSVSYCTIKSVIRSVVVDIQGEEANVLREKSESTDQPECDGLVSDELSRLIVIHDISDDISVADFNEDMPAGFDVKIYKGTIGGQVGYSVSLVGFEDGVLTASSFRLNPSLSMIVALDRMTTKGSKDGINFSQTSNKDMIADVDVSSLDLTGLETVHEDELDD